MTDTARITPATSGAEVLQQDISPPTSKSAGWFPRMRLQSTLWLGLSWLILGIPTLIYPVGRDQGVFAYIGERLFIGDRLYVDLWDVKSPLVYWMYGLALKLSGSQFIGVRLMDMLLAAVSAYLVYALTVNLRVARGQRVGVAAGILYLLWYYLPNDYRVLANCESFITPFLLLGMFLIVKAASQSEKSGVLWFWSGVALGTTMLFKTTGAVFIVPALGFAFLVPAGRTMRQRLMAAGAVGAGFVFPLLLGWMYLAHTAALEDWLYLNLTYLPAYTGVSHTRSVAREILTQVIILVELAIIYPALIFGLALFTFQIVTRWRKRILKKCDSGDQAFTFVYGVLAFAFAYALVIVIQGKYLHYHFLPLLGPLAAVVATVVLSSLEDFRVAAWKKTFALLTLTVGLAYTWELPRRYVSLGKMITDSSYATRYCEELSAGNFPCATSQRIGQYLRDESEPGDRLFVWSFEPEIYFLSGLEPASRFLFNTPFFVGEISSTWKAELRVDLMSRPPTFIIVGEEDGLPLITGGSYSSKERLKEIEGLTEFIKTNYSPVKTIGRFTILKRRVFGAVRRHSTEKRM